MLPKTGLSIMKNVLKPLAKSVLTSLGLAAATSATDADVLKKMFVSDMTPLMLSNDEMNDIMKIVLIQEIIYPK